MHQRPAAPDPGGPRTGSPDRPRPARSAAPGLLRRTEDRRALSIWLATRAGVVVLAVVAGRLFSDGDLREPFLDRWTQWDVDLLIEIARYGYGGNPAEEPDRGLPAFFPGVPLLLRAVHVVVPDWRLAALLVAAVAGAVAAVALARLGELEGPRGSGPLAVGALLLSPLAVFLFAGYTEAVFLAFALPAWLLARRGRWAPATLCLAGAATIRVTALFLALALVVEFVLAVRRGGRNAPGAAADGGAADDGGRDPAGSRSSWRTAWRAAPWLAVPFLPPAGYTLYLWGRTGDWLAWQHAQQSNWGRSLVPPWQALATTWNEAVHAGPFAGAFRAELVAAALGVLVTCWLLLRHRWAESVYVGLQMAALLTSSFYLSIGRATLLWWPLWLAIGALGTRRPWLYAGLLICTTPLMAWYVIRFTAGAWAG